MIERLPRLYNKEKTGNLTLTPYQQEIVLNFASDKKPNQFFSLFNGFLTPEEKQLFEECVTSFISSKKSLILKPNSPNCLPQIVEQLDLPKKLKQKLTEYCQLQLLTNDVLDNEDQRISFPASLIFPNLGKKLKRQLKHFLQNGGVISVFSFKKPPNFYLEAIEQQEGLSLQEKIIIVLNNKEDLSVEEKSHQFISVNLTSPQPPANKDKPNYFHLRKIINHRLDKNSEKIYSQLILMEEMLRTHITEVKLSLLSMSGIAGVFYLLDQIAKGQLNQQLYTGFQALIKITTHLMANLIDFYSQYKLFLSGDNFLNQLKDLIKKFGWREAFIFANGGVIDLSSELIGEANSNFGAFVFGLEPIIGTSLTSISGLSKIDNKNDNKFKVLFENPAVLGMNAAAFLTFLTSIGLLGMADQFHNPLAVVLVGGMSEPIFATLTTELITRRKLNEMRSKLIQFK